MVSEYANTEGMQTTPAENADLKSLERLVGTWDISGEARGRATFEWMEGGHFLQQHVELQYGDHHIKGVEIIGRLHRQNEEPSADIYSRYYSYTDSLTLDYVYELVGDTLTIWYGDRGSTDFFRGAFSEDGATATGAWYWPGGGYSVTFTKAHD